MCCPRLQRFESEGENFAERLTLSGEMLLGPWEHAGREGALPITPAKELAGHLQPLPASTGLLWDAAPKSAAAGVGWSHGDEPGLGSPLL